MDNATTRAYYHFADLVESRTDGRVMIDVYPGSQLFPAMEEFEAVVGGTVDIFADATYYFSAYVPDVMVFYIDGMWESNEHAYAALEDSELPSVFAQKIEEAAPVKMLSLLPTDTTLCFLNGVHETKSMRDLEGLRLLSSPGAAPMPVYDYTGAVAVPISFEEAAMAFTQGVIDVLQYPPSVIAEMGMHEIGGHALYYSGMFPTHAMIINTD
jgi:TRAP-type C4-dicarboxylate transport system substrate-binding protein